jgi:ABC-2 type transport system permease protein
MSGAKPEPGRSHSESLRGIYAIWWRELTVFFREKPRLVSAVASPVIWLVLFGQGFGPSFNAGGLDYQHFIFGGVLVQTFLFSSLFYGAYLVWDRKIDVLKSVLVSPLGRPSIFAGKVLGGITISLLESVVVLFVGYFLGIQFPISSIFAILGLVALASAGFTALGLTVGSVMESPEGFQLLSTLVLFPLFFLSGALFPISNLGGPLALLASLDPVTYVVDLLRGLLTGVHYIDTGFSLAVLGAFLVLSNLVGVLAFERMKN